MPLPSSDQLVPSHFSIPFAATLPTAPFSWPDEGWALSSFGPTPGAVGECRYLAAKALRPTHAEP
jgi:hypothetical protein